MEVKRILKGNRENEFSVEIRTPEEYSLNELYTEASSKVYVQD